MIFRRFISKSLRLRYTLLTFSSFANNARKRVNICKNRARFVCIFQKKQQVVLIFCSSPFGDLWRGCFFCHSGGVDELSFEGLPNQSHLIQTKKAASHESVNRLLVKSKVLCCFILAYVCLYCVHGKNISNVYLICLLPQQNICFFKKKLHRNPHDCNVAQKITQKISIIKLLLSAFKNIKVKFKKTTFTGNEKIRVYILCF